MAVFARPLLPATVTFMEITEFGYGLCRAGLAANQTCFEWTSGLNNLGRVGTEFIFHYEIAKYIAEGRDRIGGRVVGFYDSVKETMWPPSIRGPTKVSRNTRRKYLVIGYDNQIITLIQAQRYLNDGILIAECKGLLRAMTRYDRIRSAYIVGICGWTTNDPIDVELEHAKNRIITTISAQKTDIGTNFSIAHGSEPSSTLLHYPRLTRFSMPPAVFCIEMLRHS
jgi:hypothetical protein